MNSRMDKYNNANTRIGKRTQKNEELYKQVNKQNIQDFNVNSNATVLSDNGTSIDLDMLKDMLDKKYKETNKRKPLDLEFPLDDEPIDLEQTKEYDINAILEKARENKTVDYEKERLKKVRDTQYDILKNLNLNKPEEEKELDPLDLFKDLKGSENTQVIEGLKEEVEKGKTAPVKMADPKEEEEQIDNSFYTKSLGISRKDFEDFKDLEKDVKSNKVLVTVLTIIIILAFLFGIFLFLNIYFDWGII